MGIARGMWNLSEVGCGGGSIPGPGGEHVETGDAQYRRARPHEELHVRASTTFLMASGIAIGRRVSRST